MTDAELVRHRADTRAMAERTAELIAADEAAETLPLRDSFGCELGCMMAKHHPGDCVPIDGPPAADAVCGELCQPCLADDDQSVECAACCAYHGYDVEPTSLGDHDFPGWSTPYVRPVENVPTGDLL